MDVGDHHRHYPLGVGGCDLPARQPLSRLSGKSGVLAESRLH